MAFVRVPSPLPRRAALPDRWRGSPCCLRQYCASFRRSGALLSGPQPVVHLVVTARALLAPAKQELRQWASLGVSPARRHPSYAAFNLARFRDFLLRIAVSPGITQRYRERNPLGRLSSRRNHFGSEVDARRRVAAIFYTCSRTAQARRRGPAHYLSREAALARRARRCCCLTSSWPAAAS